jgi:hypothetical protein
MAGTALDPGSRRIRASVTAAGSELTLAACQPRQPDRYAVGGGNLPLHLWAAPNWGLVKGRPGIGRRAGGEVLAARRAAHTGYRMPATAYHRVAHRLPNARRFGARAS